MHRTRCVSAFAALAGFFIAMAGSVDAAPAGGQLGALKPEATKGQVEQVYWRRWHHCNWRWGHCHRRYYGYGWGGPAVVFGFGGWGHHRWHHGRRW